MNQKTTYVLYFHEYDSLTFDFKARRKNGVLEEKVIMQSYGQLVQNININKTFKRGVALFKTYVIVILIWPGSGGYNYPRVILYRKLCCFHAENTDFYKYTKRISKSKSHKEKP